MFQPPRQNLLRSGFIIGKLWTQILNIFILILTIGNMVHVYDKFRP